MAILNDLTVRGRVDLKSEYFLFNGKKITEWFVSKEMLSSDGSKIENSVNAEVADKLINLPIISNIRVGSGTTDYNDSTKTAFKYNADKKRYELSIVFSKLPNFHEDHTYAQINSVLGLAPIETTSDGRTRGLISQRAMQAIEGINGAILKSNRFSTNSELDECLPYQIKDGIYHNGKYYLVGNVNYSFGSSLSTSNDGYIWKYNELGDSTFNCKSIAAYKNKIIISSKSEIDPNDLSYVAHISEDDGKTWTSLGLDEYAADGEGNYHTYINKFAINNDGILIAAMGPSLYYLDLKENSTNLSIVTNYSTIFNDSNFNTIIDPYGNQYLRYFTDVVFGGGYFVAIAANVSTTDTRKVTQFFISKDGINWYAADSSKLHQDGYKAVNIEYGNGEFMVTFASSYSTSDLDSLDYSTNKYKVNKIMTIPVSVFDQLFNGATETLYGLREAKITGNTDGVNIVRNGLRYSNGFFYLLTYNSQINYVCSDGNTFLPENFTNMSRSNSGIGNLAISNRRLFSPNKVLINTDTGMCIISQKTPSIYEILGSNFDNRNILNHSHNEYATVEEVEKIIEDISNLQGSITGSITDYLAGNYYTKTTSDGRFAAKSHTHSEYVTNTSLTSKLSGYSQTGHTHTLSDISDLDVASDNTDGLISSSKYRLLNSLNPYINLFSKENERKIYLDGVELTNYNYVGIYKGKNQYLLVKSPDIYSSYDGINFHKTSKNINTIFDNYGIDYANNFIYDNGYFIMIANSLKLGAPNDLVIAFEDNDDLTEYVFTYDSSLNEIVPNYAVSWTPLLGIGLDNEGDDPHILVYYSNETPTSAESGRLFGIDPEYSEGDLFLQEITYWNYGAVFKFDLSNHKYYITQGFNEEIDNTGLSIKCEKDKDDPSVIYTNSHVLISDGSKIISIDKPSLSSHTGVKHVRCIDQSGNEDIVSFTYQETLKANSYQITIKSYSRNSGTKTTLVNGSLLGNDLLSPPKFKIFDMRFIKERGIIVFLGYGYDDLILYIIRTDSQPSFIDNIKLSSGILAASDYYSSSNRIGMSNVHFINIDNYILKINGVEHYFSRTPDKPIFDYETFMRYSISKNLVSKDDIDEYISKYIDTSYKDHTHEVADIVDLATKYYNKTQVDTLLSGKAESSHIHTSEDLPYEDGIVINTTPTLISNTMKDYNKGKEFTVGYLDSFFMKYSYLYDSVNFLKNVKNNIGTGTYDILIDNKNYLDFIVLPNGDYFYYPEYQKITVGDLNNNSFKLFPFYEVGSSESIGNILTPYNSAYDTEKVKYWFGVDVSTLQSTDILTIRAKLYTLSSGIILILSTQVNKTGTVYHKIAFKKYTSLINYKSLLFNNNNTSSIVYEFVNLSLNYFKDFHTLHFNEIYILVTENNLIEIYEDKSNGGSLIFDSYNTLSSKFNGENEKIIKSVYKNGNLYIVTHDKIVSVLYIYKFNIYDETISTLYDYLDATLNTSISNDIYQDIIFNVYKNKCVIFDLKNKNMYYEGSLFNLTKIVPFHISKDYAIYYNQIEGEHPKIIILSEDSGYDDFILSSNELQNKDYLARIVYASRDYMDNLRYIHNNGYNFFYNTSRCAVTGEFKPDEIFHNIYSNLLKKVEEVVVGNTILNTKDGTIVIPKASTTESGVVSVNDSYGLQTVDGELRLLDATEDDLIIRNSSGVDHPITTKNVDTAIKTVMADTTNNTWSSEEKSNAREKIGASQETIISEVDISGLSEIEIVLSPSSNNTEYRLIDNSGETPVLAQLTSQNINVRVTNGAYNNSFINGLTFRTGSNSNITMYYTGSGILQWIGTDCGIKELSGDRYSIFTPQSNMTYDIVFYFNGARFVGLVNGYEELTAEPSAELF